MSSNTAPASEREQELGAVVATCLAAVEAGQSPQDLLTRFPRFRLELEDFFASRNQIEHLAAPLRAIAEAVQSPDERTAGGVTEDSQLGDYRIIREIGRGGMGIVYEAEQLSIRRRVALKVLPFAAVLDPRQLQRFKNEAQAAGQLHHTNIVPVYAVGSDRGVHYYAMQYIEGQTLAEVIRELRQLAGLDTAGSAAAGVGVASQLASGDFAPVSPPAPSVQPTVAYSPPGDPSQRAAQTTQPKAVLSTERSTKSLAFIRSVARLGVQAAEALDHAHESGVVHRDIKPSNLLLDKKGNLWITDFGLAHFQTDTNLTMTGDLIGTIRYMSPEQALAKRVIVDHRTDIYSLGVTLYELLTLEPIFDGRDRQELLRQIAFEEPRPPRRVNKAIPAELETIVLKATAKNPAERYASAQELAEDLERLLRDEPIQARRPTLLQRAAKLARRHQAVVVTIALSVLALLLTAVVGLKVSNRMIREEKRLTEEALRAEAEQRESAEANLRKAREAVDKYYTLVSQSTLLQEPSLIPLRRELLQSALAFYQEFVNQKSDDPRIRGELAATYFRVAQITSESGSGEWLEPSRKAVEIVERLVQENSDIREHPSFMAGVFDQPGGGAAANDHAAVIPVYQKGRAIWEKFVEQNPTSAGLRQDLSACYWQLGIEYRETRQLDESLRYSILACDTIEKLVQETNEPKYRMLLAATRRTLAMTYSDLRRFEEAEKELKAAISLIARLSEDFPNVPNYKGLLAATLNSLALRLWNNKRHEEAQELLSQALALQEQLVADFPAAAGYRQTLSVFYCNAGEFNYITGNWAEAVRRFEKSMSLGSSGDGYIWFLLAVAHWQLGEQPDTSLEDQSKHKTEARQWYDRAVEWMEKNEPEEEVLKRRRAAAEKLFGQ